MISKSYIDNTLDKGLPDDVITACYNLSSLLMDYSGKVGQPTAQLVARYLQVTLYGTILWDQSEQTTGVSGWSSHIDLDQFSGKLSNHASDMYRGMVLFDSTIVAPVTDSVGAGVQSSLLTDMESLPPVIRLALCALYVELYCIYTSLLSLKSGEVISTMSTLDMYRLGTDIRWISNQLEAMDLPNYDLIRVLRAAQRTILYIKGMDTLFDKTLSNHVLDLGGVQDDQNS